MRTKLEAVRTATAVGVNVIIANGKRTNVLNEIMQGDDIGTLFLGEGDGVSAWKRWIGYTMPPKGRFVLDHGARRAVEQQGKSLLAAGIARVEGDFPKGEVVSLVDAESGEEFARGLTNYDSIAARSIAGQRKEEITRTLGSIPYDEVIHRDNLVVTSIPKGSGE
jgi:glutamate 5-kinase